MIIDRAAADVAVTFRGGDAFLRGLTSTETLTLVAGSIQLERFANDAATDGPAIDDRFRIADVVIQPGAVLSVTGGRLEAVGPCGFENGGTVSIRDGTLAIAGGYTFNNLAGGVLDIDVEGGGVPGSPVASSGVPGISINESDLNNRAGAIVRVRGDIVGSIAPRFHNIGDFSVNEGTLKLSGGEFINDAGGRVSIAWGGPTLPPGGGVPGSPVAGGGVPGLSASGTLIDNSGIMFIAGVELTGHAMLLNRRGARLEVAGGGVPGSPVAGGGVPGIALRYADMENHAGAAIEVTGGSVEVVGPCNFENAGRFRIVGGSLSLAHGFQFNNRAGGLVEIDVEGGGVPGSPVAGGGVPGITIEESDLYNHAGANIQVKGGISSAIGPSYHNAGTFRVSGGGLQLTGGEFINEFGGRFDIDVEGGGVPGISIDQSELENQAGAVINTGSATVEINDSRWINSGVLTTTGGVNLSGGRLSGIGVINGNLFNGGVVAPGLSPGTLTINGDYAQTADGVLEMEIAGSQFDRLVVAGSASLDGLLRVQIPNGMTPSAGNRFQLLTFGEQNGTFASTEVMNPLGDVDLEFTIGPGGLTTRSEIVSHVTAQVVNGQLVVSGDQAANTLSIELGAGGRFNVRLTGTHGTRLNGQSNSIVMTGVTRGMLVNLARGDDYFIISGQAAGLSIKLNGGAGDDTYGLTLRRANLVIVDFAGADWLDFSGTSCPIQLRLDQDGGQRQSIMPESTLALRARSRT